MQWRCPGGRIPGRQSRAWPCSRLYVLAVHFQFQVHSGWATDASTVPAVATALLLPPGVGMLIAGIGLLTYTVSTGGRHRLGLKGLFNTGSAMLAVGAAAHLASALGGPTLLTSGSGWTALPVAVLASTAYYLVSAATVAGAVALDQRRSDLDGAARKDRRQGPGRDRPWVSGLHVGGRADGCARPVAGAGAAGRAGVPGQKDHGSR